MKVLFDRWFILNQGLGGKLQGLQRININVR